MGLAAAAMVAAQVGYKTRTGTLLFLLQPCHVLMGVMALLCLAPPRPWTGAASVGLLPWLTGVWAAIVLPETGELTEPYEAAVYFAEHGLVRAAAAGPAGSATHPP